VKYWPLGSTFVDAIKEQPLVMGHHFMKAYIVCDAKPNNDSPIFGVYTSEAGAIQRMNEVRAMDGVTRYPAVYCIELDAPTDGDVFAFIDPYLG
jgi:hypothetical protein